MPCYHPITGYRGLEVNPETGKRGIVFSPRGTEGERIQFACGQCIGCRLERSRVWAVRCMHEAQLYDDNCFITLTYSPENLPRYGTLVLGHWQKFMKRLRAYVSERDDRKLRFFHCGEYGTQGGRPHYHGLIFNYNFPDRVPYRRIQEHTHDTSEILSRLWPFGFSTVGDVSFDSAAYVARYITKKHLGPGSEVYYDVVDETTGEIVGLQKEYVTMSRRPGIGREWIKLHRSHVYSRDSVIVNGHETKPPRYYDNVFEVDYPERLEEIKSARLAKARIFRPDNTHDRLLVREEVHYARAKLLKRGYEDGE